MINKIKNLIGGKSNGFYLEADEDENNQSTSTKVEKTTTTEEVAAPEPVVAATEEVAAPEPAQEKSAKKSKKTSIKDSKKTATTTAPASIPVSASSNGASSPSYWEQQPSWVKAMYKKDSSSNGNAGGGEQTFATDNLLPTPSTYRRRPGPSLNKFKEMARQAKIRRR